MIKNVLSDIGGVGLYGIISVCLFFIIFTTAIVWALLRKKSFCQAMSALPLDDGIVPSVKGDSDHE
jgi:cbb3-type cytochrome oxidase subunit 3